MCALTHRVGCAIARAPCQSGEWRALAARGGRPAAASARTSAVFRPHSHNHSGMARRAALATLRPPRNRSTPRAGSSAPPCGRCAHAAAASPTSGWTERAAGPGLRRARARRQAVHAPARAGPAPAQRSVRPPPRRRPPPGSPGSPGSRCAGASRRRLGAPPACTAPKAGPPLGTARLCASSRTARRRQGARAPSRASRPRSTGPRRWPAASCRRLAAAAQCPRRRRCWTGPSRHP
eukprot:scaffold35866_cov124-Isochrysis_galbana.AAC.5